MKEFFKNEWRLFLEDMRELGEFCLQPVEITFWGKSNLMLKPTYDEVEAKVQDGEVGFWQNEWNLFKQDLKNAKEFLTQPVEFK